MQQKADNDTKKQDRLDRLATAKIAEKMAATEQTTATINLLKTMMTVFQAQVRISTLSQHNTPEPQQQHCH